MKRGRLRLRLARWLESTVHGPASAAAGPVAPARSHAPEPADAADTDAAWPRICERFALQTLVLAEQLRPALDRLEDDEEDPDRLQRLYHVDHAVTRMRRIARDLRILSGLDDEEMAGHVSSLVDVIRMAESSIERYTQVQVGTVAELAVVAYAADDIASLLAALLDNATRYSPSATTVSAHLLDDGGVLMRIEDNGIGIGPEQLAAVNTMLADPDPRVDGRTGRHTGFPVVHRMARKHGVRVGLVRRSSSGSDASSGTTATVTLPPRLLCEIPAPAPAGGRRPDPAVRRPAGGAAADGGSGGHVPPAHLTVAHRSEPAGTDRAAGRSGAPQRPLTTVNDLPRRERKSIRGGDDGAPPASTPPSPSPARDPAVVRRSFAEDVSAFTAGDHKARWSSAPGSGDDDPEEQVP
ncbi:anti-sigma regulatory factor (Ser/Thr protein kinase) [Spinactinospora alkalitolerans]|uniref:histidine kinase n=1 Tax=Spinactinospora alkalitolerans TaxID=687207 RepID=A0A852TPL9_9ACTN|nr:sensor histidine kinase [Spinactinospora alkalitolerans]NYE45939.1 anti-sigma regulatory factor (Ser/Thr protein kinase) [Spinactinospora alkalitolerans]